MRVGDLVLVTAPWDTFKSTLGLELAWSLATGQPWLTHYPVLRTMRVGILQVEIDPGSYDERLKWFPAADELLAASCIGFTFDHMEKLVERIEDAALDAVVLDPLGQLWPSYALNGEPFQENLKTHVSPIMRELKKLRRSVIVVHHDPKPSGDNKNRASGSAALLNDPDVRLFVDRNKDGSVQVTVRNRLQRAAKPFRAVFNEETRRMVWAPLGARVTSLPPQRLKEHEELSGRVAQRVPRPPARQATPPPRPPRPNE